MPVFTSSIEVTADYPTIKPSLNLNFARSRSLDPRITFTRASVGTYVGRDGLIKTAGNDEARFDHDPVTLESLGLLIEESRTNVTTYSTDYTNAVYNKLDATVVDNQAVAPDGTTTADLLHPSSTGTGRGLEINTFVLGAGKWTTSLYVKSAGLSWIALYGVNGGARAYFDVSNGTKGSANGGGDPIDDWDIIDAGNGWYRCYITIDLQSAGGTEYFYIYFGSSDNSTTVTANGTDGVYIWGTQVEAGSFPTSYIPTSGSSVTRAVDQAYILGDNVPLGSGVDEYSFYVRGRLLNTDNIGGISRGLVGMGSSSSNRIRIPHNNGSAVEIYSGGSLVAALNTGDIGTTERQIALAVKKDDFAMSMDGGTVQTDTSGDIPTFINDIALGCSTYDPAPLTYPSTSYIKEFRIYPKRLTNAQLQLLTS